MQPFVLPQESNPQLLRLNRSPRYRGKQRQKKHTLCSTACLKTKHLAINPYIFKSQVQTRQYLRSTQTLRYVAVASNDNNWASLPQTWDLPTEGRVGPRDSLLWKNLIGQQINHQYHILNHLGFLEVTFQSISTSPSNRHILYALHNFLGEIIFTSWVLIFLKGT